MRKLLLLGSLITVLVPTAPYAHSLGVRASAAFPMGDIANNAKLSDAVKWQIPIQVDAMFGITPDLSVGVYGSYGFGFLGDQVKDACDAFNVSCSTSGWRVGAQLAYAFNQMSPTFVPWVGVGTGWEWLKIKSSFGGVTSEATSNGWEYVNLQLGGDYKVTPKFAVGPFVQYSIGQFRTTEGTDIPDKATHEWLGVGLRGKFDI